MLHRHRADPRLGRQTPFGGKLAVIRIRSANDILPKPAIERKVGGSLLFADHVFHLVI